MTVVCECVFCDVVVCAQFRSTIRDVKQSTDEKQHRRNSDNDNRNSDTNINNTEVDNNTADERYNSDVNKDFNDVAKSLDSIISGFEARKSRDTMTEWFKKRRNDVNFVVDDWAIRIWKENVFSAKTFPKVIFIEYRTKPCGQSVLWRKNQVDCLMKTCMLSAGVRVHAWGLKP